MDKTFIIVLHLFTEAPGLSGTPLSEAACWIEKAKLEQFYIDNDLQIPYIECVKIQARPVQGKAAKKVQL